MHRMFYRKISDGTAKRRYSGRISEINFQEEGYE